MLQNAAYMQDIDKNMLFIYHILSIAAILQHPPEQLFTFLYPRAHRNICRYRGRRISPDKIYLPEYDSQECEGYNIKECQKISADI